MDSPSSKERAMTDAADLLAHGAVAIKRLIARVSELERENQALRNLANNLRPGPISEALAGNMAEEYARAGLPPSDTDLADLMSSYNGDVGVKDERVCAVVRELQDARAHVPPQAAPTVPGYTTDDDIVGTATGHEVKWHEDAAFHFTRHGLLALCRELEKAWRRPHETTACLHQFVETETVRLTVPGYLPISENKIACKLCGPVSEGERR